MITIICNNNCDDGDDDDDETDYDADNFKNQKYFFVTTVLVSQSEHQIS